MATVTTEAPVAAPEHAPVATSAVAAPVRVMALTLWAVVGSLLTYGVTMTAIKAAALFS